MITVVMPEWRRLMYRAAPLLCLGLFLLIEWLVTGPILSRLFFPPRILVMMVFLLPPAPLAVLAAAGWFERRIIAECSYDGSTLRFTTVGCPDEEVRPILDLSDIDEWREYRSRFAFQSLVGFRLRFRDRQKRYLDPSVPNTRELVARLQADRWPKPPSDP
jgi:hypothetical protein